MAQELRTSCGFIRYEPVRAMVLAINKKTTRTGG